MPIKPPSGITPSQTSQTTQTGQAEAKPVTQPRATQNIISPEAVQQALRDYDKIKKRLKKMPLKGLSGLFTDSVSFPPDLLDPKNPENDIKYLHLLLAVFGMKELKKLFATLEQNEEEEKLENEGEDTDHLREETGRGVSQGAKKKNP